MNSVPVFRRAALALAACGDSGSITDAPTSVGASIKVADYSALATVGGVALVTLNGGALSSPKLRVLNITRSELLKDLEKAVETLLEQLKKTPPRKVRTQIPRLGKNARP